jgi:hypothetical protein
MRKDKHLAAPLSQVLMVGGAVDASPLGGALWIPEDTSRIPRHD